jgi:hypothetical protein
MSRINLGACCVVLSFLCMNSLVEAVAQNDPFGGEGGYVQELGGGRGGGGRGGYEDRGGYGRGEMDGGRGMAMDGGMGMEMSAAQRIESVLQQPLKAPLQYEDQPLNEVIDTLQSEYDIPIMFDNNALEEVAITPDTEITINLRNVSLRSALNLIFRQPALDGLTYTIDDEVLLITTNENANDRLVVAIYRVDHLVQGEAQWAQGQHTPYTPLVQVITSCVKQNSWAINGQGGLGQIHLMQPGILVVSQTKQIQPEVEHLLDKLTGMRSAMEQPTAE